MLPKTNDNEDAELLRRYAEENSEAAFAELTERHVEFVYAAALRQLGGAAHRAEDVTQQVFIDLARKAATLARRAEIVGWLHTSTHHAAAKLQRDEQRRQHREQEAHSMQDIRVGSASDNVDWERLSPLLDSTLQELGERDRTAILLRFFQGRRFAEIGQRLGMSEDGARMRTERALEKLHGLLARRKITSTTAALGLLLANQPAMAAPAGLAASVARAALGATSGGGAVVGLFSYINAKIGMMVGLAVAGLGISAAVYQNSAAQRSRLGAEAMARERDALREQVNGLRKSKAAEVERRGALERSALAELETKAAKLAEALKAVPKVAPVSEDKPAVLIGENGEPVVPKADGRFTLMTSSADPVEQRKRVRAVNGKAVDSAYAALYQKLEWTVEQRELFKGMMLDREESGSELFRKAVAAARVKNPAMDRADQFEILEALQTQLQTEQQVEARRMFGEAVGDALEHFQTTQPVRFIARELTSERFQGGPPLTVTPLTPTQTDQLIEIMASNAQGTVSKVDVAVLNIEAVVAQARERGLLNEGQLAELRTQVKRAQEQQKAQRAQNMMPAAEVRAKFGK